VAALIKAGWREQAAQALEKLAEVNRLGIEEEWEFNEWYHGRTGRPMGYPHQAWSAGMYVFAHRCVQECRVPIFDETWNNGQ
jgi:glycogen debranching enzyme